MCSGRNVCLTYYPSSMLYIFQNCHTLYSVTNIFSMNFCKLLTQFAYNAYFPMQKWLKYHEEIHLKDSMCKSRKTSFEKFSENISTDIFFCFIIFSFIITISISYSIICVPYLYIFVYIIFSILVFYFFSLFSISSSSSHSFSKSVLVNILK